MKVTSFLLLCPTLRGCCRGGGAVGIIISGRLVARLATQAGDKQKREEQDCDNREILP